MSSAGISDAADMSKHLQESDERDPELFMPAGRITIGDLIGLVNPFPPFICLHSW